MLRFVIHSEGEDYGRDVLLIPNPDGSSRPHVITLNEVRPRLVPITRDTEAVVSLILGNGDVVKFLLITNFESFRLILHPTFLNGVTLLHSASDAVLYKMYMEEMKNVTGVIVPPEIEDGIGSWMFVPFESEQAFVA